ncbi:ATP-binding cassette domain-containing protein [Aureimonas psammosilenae]|uniref:ATP-binding cassette domain-containing protein n=1 Tax=Aureimonas psammosilenae TaxID=2495496 RepID=UPI001260E1F4|nr:ATP-binding cassette domain-containing protein [Aureimonas psammosilenae]
MPEPTQTDRATSRVHQTMAAAARGRVRPAPPVETLALDGIAKRYGETVALAGASLTFTPGIHTILGENGSGKSTMLKILSGVVDPSEGRLLLGGREFTAGSPREMRDRGLSTVFQEVLIAPHRSVADNVFLGTDGFLRRTLARAEAWEAARALLGLLARFPIDPDALAGTLPLASQQIVVIARALARLPSILLLDEATAALDYADRDRVFEVVEDYARHGALVIFISHRMEEVKRLSDRVTVLRSGRLVETLARGEVTSRRLLDLMAPEARLHVA